ncbi:nuclear pore complex protein Nup50 [Rhynchophorus ferrugineus]|uniref:nuclear pore complex protein Nup50 n=1 Tax=Rhynchophorus ferrugineus TaxID=354439 RepID=UPI003FCE4845
MAGKRSATSELNHDNWDQEEDVEVQGTFQKASNETLKSRVIKTAKRRNPIRSEEGSEKKSAFASFTGFGTKASTDFSFLSNTSKSDSTPKTNGIDNNVSKINSIFNFNPKTSPSIFGAPVTTSTTCTNIFESNNVASNSIVPSTSSVTNKSEKYCSKLKGLNESVSKWISKKVEENPLISLQPIFKDYEKYLDEIDKEEATETKADKVDKSETKTSIPTFNFTPTTNKNNKAIADSTTEKSTKVTEITSTTTTSSFGITSTISTSTKPTFSFGSANNASEVSKSFSSLNSSSSTPTYSFTFGSNTTQAPSKLTSPMSTGFTFGKITTAEEKDKPKADGEEGNDEDEPPKVEFQPVVEKDHIYTVKCKVFVKNGDNFGDRGVGNLYLKKIDNSEKIQLIVRANTSLGNLLLNFILSESVPTKRMGKKDVMLVTIPTPDAQPPPVPLLIRVKSAEDADKLLEVLEKHKK